MYRVIVFDNCRGYVNGCEVVRPYGIKIDICYYKKEFIFAIWSITSLNEIVIMCGILSVTLCLICKI